MTHHSRLKSWTRRAACTGIALAALAACSGQTTPPDSYYRLSQSDVPSRAGGMLPGTVDVTPFRADGMLNDRQIMHRDGAIRIAGYNYHYWWKAPGVVLQDSLVDALRRANAFQIVTTPELRLDRAYEVVGRIRRFEQDGAQVVVEVELLLRATRSGAPLLLKTYRHEVPAGDGNIPAAVDAFGVAVGQVWTDFIDDLASVKPPPV